ncbi:colicin transporter [Ruania suaedae]|uniref:SAV_6107 family HEPN domain-containing protein n=1 Tax=Ruania suaedae TaxID=2897774 RepID=UPI001E361693|nr:SAV_6107 family HEPN domain-containing protein [Ruania suaedae]UFU04217.1 colicin transporter [Ruania suaedae]
MVGTTAGQLLRRAQLELGQVHSDGDLAGSFLHAHMAALRAGAAVLALHPGHSTSRSRRRQVRSVWEQLGECGPEWEPWAAYFAQGAAVRAAIETGRPVDLSAHHVEEVVAAATDLVDRVAQVARERQPSAPALAS